MWFYYRKHSYMITKIINKCFHDRVVRNFYLMVSYFQLGINKRIEHDLVSAVYYRGRITIARDMFYLIGGHVIKLGITKIVFTKGSRNFEKIQSCLEKK